MGGNLKQPILVILFRNMGYIWNMEWSDVFFILGITQYSSINSL